MAIGAGPKVLMVDDEPHVRRVAELSLARVGGFAVALAAGGAEALAAVERERPDLVLLDVMMPGMDGPTTFHALQENAAVADIPVIFMTAKVQEHEIQRLLALGAAGVIRKPFDPLLLPEEVRRILSSSGRRRVGGGEATDAELAVHRARYASQLPRFLADLAAELDAIADGGRPHARPDATLRATKMAHRLRGTAGSYGFDAVGEVAGQIEDALEAGRPVSPEIRRALAALADQGGGADEEAPPRMIGDTSSGSSK